jgi:hypothetical protein
MMVRDAMEQSFEPPRVKLPSIEAATVPNGGVLRSYGDNYIDGNGDGDPALATIAKK